MRLTAKSLLPTLAASLALSACGSSGSSTGASTQAGASSSSSAGASTVSVKTAANATLGATVLTDPRGMTLYALSGEGNGRFICASSSCTQIWHPLVAPAGAAPSGASSLATVKRPDGTEQVTYGAMPLYTFAQDQHPGDANGQGLKDVGTWSAVKVGAGAPAAGGTQSTPSAPPAETKTKGYGY